MIAGATTIKMTALRCAGAIVLSLLAVSTCRAQAKKITPADAKDHVGEHATVCGRVVSTHFAKTTKCEPTFLNLDEPYPRQIFTILIWGSDRSKFGVPETRYRDQQVCVMGVITSFKGSPEVVANEPAQILVQK
jgi:hypothetical protein